MKADQHFPICLGGCGRRGSEVVWYHVARGDRFGECLRCYADREEREKRDQSKNRAPAEDPRWDPPDEDDRPSPWRA